MVCIPLCRGAYLHDILTNNIVRFVAASAAVGGLPVRKCILPRGKFQVKKIILNCLLSKTEKTRENKSMSEIAKRQLKI